MARLRERRNLRVATGLAAVVIAMVGLSFASVPLYRLFCEATGYSGTTQRAVAAPDRDATGDAVVTVRFNAETASDLILGQATSRANLTKTMREGRKRWRASLEQLKDPPSRRSLRAINLVGTFASENDLVAGVAHRAAQQELGNTVPVDKRCFGMPDGISEMISQVRLLNGNGTKKKRCVS